MPVDILWNYVGGFNCPRWKAIDGEGPKPCYCAKTGSSLILGLFWFFCDIIFSRSPSWLLGWKYQFFIKHFKYGGGFFCYNMVSCKLMKVLHFFLVITKKCFSSYLWSLFSRMVSLLPFHWWIEVMYFIYWRKLISKVALCYPQQRFIHRTILWTVLLSEFWKQSETTKYIH